MKPRRQPAEPPRHVPAQHRSLDASLPSHIRSWLGTSEARHAHVPAWHRSLRPSRATFLPGIVDAAKSYGLYGSTVRSRLGTSPPRAASLPGIEAFSLLSRATRRNPTSLSHRGRFALPQGGNSNFVFFIFFSVSYAVLAALLKRVFTRASTLKKDLATRVRVSFLPLGSDPRRARLHQATLCERMKRLETKKKHAGGQSSDHFERAAWANARRTRRCTARLRTWRSSRVRCAGQRRQVSVRPAHKGRAFRANEREASTLGRPAVAADRGLAGTRPTDKTEAKKLAWRRLP